MHIKIQYTKHEIAKLNEFNVVLGNDSGEFYKEIHQNIDSFYRYGGKIAVNKENPENTSYTFELEDFKIDICTKSTVRKTRTLLSVVNDFLGDEDEEKIRENIITVNVNCSFYYNFGARNGPGTADFRMHLRSIVLDAKKYHSPVKIKTKNLFPTALSIFHPDFDSWHYETQIREVSRE